MDNQGWIKLYRKLLDNGISQKPEYGWLWINLLLLANHEDGHSFIWNGKRHFLKKGQLLTGRVALAEQTGINQNKVYRILKYLENEQQIEQQKTTKYTIITILNWDKYQQVEQQTEQQVNNKRTTTEQQVNTFKNVKNDKNEKNIYNAYKEKINSGSRLTESSRKKIISRLKTFSELELLQAIDNFAGDTWWMENNAHRGVAWFFNSDDRIDQFLNLKGKKQVGGFNPSELPLL
jgi:DNA-binding transcriptional regulator YhcF (GntR family)